MCLPGFTWCASQAWRTAAGRCVCCALWRVGADATCRRGATSAYGPRAVCRRCLSSPFVSRDTSRVSTPSLLTCVLYAPPLCVDDGVREARARRRFFGACVCFGCVWGPRLRLVVWYARARYRHTVGGVPHTTARKENYSIRGLVSHGSPHRTPHTAQSQIASSPTPCAPRAVALSPHDKDTGVVPASAQDRNASRGGPCEPYMGHGSRPSHAVFSLRSACITVGARLRATATHGSIS